MCIRDRNNGSTLEYTIKSVLRAEVPPKYEKEIIVVDARSTDNTPEILAKYKDKIKVIYDEGKGIGIARNMGILASRGDDICFVDADCIVGKDHFKKIIKCLEEGADIVDVHARPPAINRLNLPKISKLELIVWEVSKVYTNKRLLKNRCFAGGAFMSFKREVFWKVGGLWSYPPYGADDMDFSYRAYRRGCNIRAINVFGTINLPRFTLPELIREQKGWGKGYAYFIGKYRNDRLLWKCYDYPNVVYKLLSKYTWIYTIIGLMMAPLKGLALSIKLKNPHFMFYWIIRRYSFLFGLLLNLKKAFMYFSKHNCSSISRG